MLVEDPVFSGDTKKETIHFLPSPPEADKYPEASIPAEAGFYEWAYLKT